MSYCQCCPGSYTNIMYSFGADYDGDGDANDLSNWSVNPNLIANYDSSHFSVQPEREAQKMYLHVSSKSPTGCVAVSSPTPLPPTSPVQNPLPNIDVASFDDAIGAPKCSNIALSCFSGKLLLSRDSIQGVSEPNGSNTLDLCTDGTAGHFHSDESGMNLWFYLYVFLPNLTVHKTFCIFS